MSTQDVIRREVLASALKHGLVEGRELLSVPEILGPLQQMSTQIVSDMAAYHASRDESIHMGTIQQAYCYIFAKGMEIAYLWHMSPTGRGDVSYSAVDMLSGRVGARVSQDFQSAINRLIPRMEESFLDIQTWLKAHYHEIAAVEDGVQLCLAACLEESGLVGIHCGMKALRY